ncbi:MAG: hypothetical protein ACI4S1_13630, partial [Roseburia sp.]
KEIEIEISEEEYKKLQPSEEKKTGYERVPKPNIYFYATPSGGVDTTCEDCYDIDNECYESANYYSDKIIAENNARADRLMRQLRRFSVEHREHEVDFNSTETAKHYIYYDCIRDELRATYTFYAGVFGVIYFDSEETAQAAIDEFRDELIWYFTEYKDSL